MSFYISSLWQAYTNSLPSTLLTSNVQPAREPELQYSPFPMTQSMPTKYSNTASSISGPTISMPEVPPLLCLIELLKFIALLRIWLRLNRNQFISLKLLEDVLWNAENIHVKQYLHLEGKSIFTIWRSVWYWCWLLSSCGHSLKCLVNSCNNCLEVKAPTVWWKTHITLTVCLFKNQIY